MIPSFKHFLQTSEAVNADIAEKIRTMIDGSGFVLFFEKDKQVFGANEGSRIIFASLKNPSDEEPSGWEKEATFMAQNLSNIINGDGAQAILSKDDLKKIKVIDSESAYKKLLKQAEKEPVDKRIKFVITKR